MICEHDEAEIKLGKKDALLAIQMFLNKSQYSDDSGKYNVVVTDIFVNRRGGKYLLTAKVENKITKERNYERSKPRKIEAVTTSGPATERPAPKVNDGNNTAG